MLGPPENTIEQKCINEKTKGCGLKDIDKQQLWLPEEMYSIVEEARHGSKWRIMMGQVVNDLPKIYPI